MIMNKYLEGWKDVGEVYIPKLVKTGFKNNIIIREKIAPKEDEKVIYPAEIEDLTIPVWDREQSHQEQEDDETVLLNSKKVAIHILIERINTGEEMEITKSPFVIGKSKDCDFVVCDNLTVSRCHAQILKTVDGYVLRDMNSTNHSYVDSVLVKDTVELKDRMEIKLSNEKFLFKVEIR